MSDDLRNIVAAIERIRDDKKGLSADEGLEFAKAKSAGFDGKALRRVLQRRAMDDAARDEFDALVDMYENALGGKAVARDAIKAGATVRQAAKKAGISVGAAQAQRSKIQIPEHDAETGEIIPASPAGAFPKGATDSDPVDAAPPAIPAGDTVSLSVHHNGEVLVDSGPMSMAALKAIAPDLRRLSEAELVDRAMAAKPAHLARGTA